MNKAEKFFIVICSLMLAVAVAAGIFLSITQKNADETVTQINAEEIDAQINSKIVNTQINTKEISFLFLGDIMFDRYIRQAAEKKSYEYILEDVKPLLWEQDLVVANLEGPVTDNQSVSKGTVPGDRRHMIFTFDPVVANLLSDHNIRLVNIGNNHILNFGDDGLEQTKKYLSDAGIDYIGDPENPENYLVKNIGGWKMALVSYNYAEKDGADNSLKNIKRAAEQSDKVIVYAHWGTEYSSRASQNQKDLARRFIDQGAGLVIGSHPHVIQESEEYGGKKIYYSLGNFIFDQYFDPKAMKGLAVRIIVNPESGDLEYEEYEIEMKTNGQTVLKW